MSDIDNLKGYDFLKKTKMPLEEMSKHVRKKAGNIRRCFADILILTYKRDTTLKAALESALNQKDFDDYQIIVMDNAGISDIETSTEKLIRSYNDPKIVYYQQDEEFILQHRDLNIALANSLYMEADAEWVCMMHDDDILSEDYLKLMSAVVNKYDDIEGVISDLNMIVCESDDNAPLIEYSKRPGPESSRLLRITEKKYPDRYVHFVLGAFMKLSLVKEIGGYPCDYKLPGFSGMSDFVFAVKYAYYHKTFFLCDSLYGYRISAGSSSARKDIWKSIHTCRAYFIRSVAARYPFPFNVIMKAAADYETIDQIGALNDPEKNIFRDDHHLDVEKMLKDCDIKTYSGVFGRKRRLLVEKLAVRIRKKYTSSDIRTVEF